MKQLLLALLCLGMTGCKDVLLVERELEETGISFDYKPEIANIYGVLATDRKLFIKAAKDKLLKYGYESDEGQAFYRICMSWYQEKLFDEIYQTEEDIPRSSIYLGEIDGARAWAIYYENNHGYMPVVRSTKH